MKSILKPLQHKFSCNSFNLHASFLPDYSQEELGSFLEPKLQSFGHLIPRADSSEKTLMLGKIEGGRRRGRQRLRWLGGIIHSIDMIEQVLGVGDGQGGLVCCSP